jgi:hypothetical protein
LSSIVILSKPFALALTLAVTTAVIPRAARAQATPSVTTADEERRRALYQEGKAAIKAMHWVDAKTALEQAWAITPSYDVALLLAQAELNLGHNAEAARLLAYYFRNVSAKESEKTYANAKKGFERAKQQVSSVTVTAPEGAALFVDGKPVGTAPLDGSLFVNPGSRTFEARRSDTKVMKTLDAVAGQEQTISLGFPEPSPTAAPAAANPEASVGAGLSDPVVASNPVSSDRRSGTDGPSVVPVVVGGSITLVALGLGIGYRVAAASSHSDFLRLQEKNGDGGCANGSASPADCSAQRDAVDSEDHRRRLSTGAFVVAGVAAVSTAVYWFWPRGSAANKAAGKGALRFNAAVSPAGSGLWLSGSF